MKTLSSPKRAGQTVIMPFIGETTVDADGKFECADEFVADLLKADIGVEDPDVKAEVKEAAPVVKTEKELQKEAAIANISGMKKAELVKLAEEAGLPIESYQDLKVGDLKDLLISKIA